MAALAVRLDELAQANAEGLLNDDEYRLLRQDLFERYTPAGPIIPDPAPILGTIQNHPYPSLMAKPEVTFDLATPHPRASHPLPSKSAPHAYPEKPTGQQPKFGKTLFLRRTSGKRDDTALVISPTISKDKKPRSPMRSLTRKFSDFALSLTHSEAAGAKEAKRRHPRKISDPGSSMPPMSPSRSSASSGRSLASLQTPTSTVLSTYSRRSNVSSSPRPSNVTPTSLKRSGSGSSTSLRPALSATTFIPPRAPSSSSEIFDDSNLGSMESIRNAIGSTQAELGKLADMFNRMEERVIERLAQQSKAVGITPSMNSSSSHLGSPSSSKTIISSLSTAPSPTASASLRRKASFSSFLSTPNSSHSNLPSTLIKSTSTLAPPPLIRSRSGSPVNASEDFSNSLSLLQPRDQLLHVRKASLRSIRSDNALNRSQRSVHHLAPPKSMLTSRGHNLDFVGGGVGGEPIEPFLEVDFIDSANQLPIREDDRHALQSLQKELADVRRRKDEVVWRYEARLEYLRVRLKGAELAEKVARR